MCITKNCYENSGSTIQILEKISGDSDPSYANLLESVWSKDVKRPHYDKKLLDEIGFSNTITIYHIDV